ncbi:hypothetical protein [Actinomadura montaniterrae]|uniref:Uncharacterized protein n=1 Tax=Actinomadura montaniterrae TaxID=1803903 RepID=A0A6L3VY21_9ACTN|nr:hypothetical protein [Actinomadura montaniterrae]KAB2380252.1 hypothetical protein F9B16_18100 [Actinomadura montaniterrae]
MTESPFRPLNELPAADQAVSIPPGLKRALAEASLPNPAGRGFDNRLLMRLSNAEGGHGNGLTFDNKVFIREADFSVERSALRGV